MEKVACAAMPLVMASFALALAFGGPRVAVAQDTLAQAVVPTVPAPGVQVQSAAQQVTRFPDASRQGNATAGVMNTILFLLLVGGVITGIVIWKRKNGSGAANEVLFGREGSYNRIYRANLTGGIVGWLGVSAKRSLANAIAKANDDGFEVVFIVEDSNNLLKSILYFIILVLTLFIWCPAPGFLIIVRPIDLDQ